MTSPVRTGQARSMSRREFGERFRQRFVDPAFDAEREAIGRLEEIAWAGFHGGRKTPLTVKAGAGLVCADGGNPDPSSTQGKQPELARKIELDGWDYPKHLAGRVYGLVVHGDVAGIESTRRALSDWLDWMGLLDAGAGARLDRFIGYYEPYATSHDALDGDGAVQQEVRRAARAVAIGVGLMRDGRMKHGDERIPPPRKK